MSRSIPSSRRGLWFIAGAGTLWGTTGVTTQLLYDLSQTNALSVAILRMAIGALILLLLCVLFLGKRMWSIKGRDVLLLFFMGVMQAIFQFCYLAAIPDCGITVATLIALCVAPVVVVLFSATFLHERLTRRILLALCGALCGTALLTGVPAGGTTSNYMLQGILLSLASASGYAGTILGGRVLSSRYHPLQINTASFGIGALLLFICSFGAHLVLNYPGQSWLLLFYLGCIPTALAYILFQTGMRSVSATLTSILTLCEPLTAAILAWIFFGERLNIFGLLGALLLLGTLCLLALGKPAPSEVLVDEKSIG